MIACDSGVKMNKKRQMWIQVCLLWTVLWIFVGFFIWPCLLLAALSASMILIPIGVDTSAPPVRQHDPNAWRTENQRPWNQ